jgi:hypothetical protein
MIKLIASCPTRLHLANLEYQEDLEEQAESADLVEGGVDLEIDSDPTELLGQRRLVSLSHMIQI